MGNPPRPPFTYSWPPAALIHPGEKLPRAQRHVLLSRKPEAAPGPVVQGAASSWTGEAASEGPARSWIGTARKILSSSVLLGLSTPPSQNWATPHPPCTRKARARPPGTEAILPGKQEQHSVAVSLRSHVPPAACPGGGRQAAPCTPPRGAGPWSSERRAKPTYGVGAGPGQRQASFDQPRLLHRAH